MPLRSIAEKSETADPTLTSQPELGTLPSSTSTLGEETARSRKAKIAGGAKAAAGKVGKGLGKITSVAGNAVERLDAQLAAQEEKNDQHVKQMMDRAMQRSVRKVLKLVGGSVNEMMKPAYAPQQMCRMADYMFAGSWPDVENQLQNMIMASVSSTSKKLKASQLRLWAKAPPLWSGKVWRSRPIRPLSWLRCKVLYALLPADANKFRHLGDPVALSIVLAKMTSTFGINVMIFIVIFFMIDRSDESQLVRYILSFKAFQFVSGLVAATTLSSKFFACLKEVALDGTASCEPFAPGNGGTFPFIICLELIRMTLLLAAGVVLAGGGAWGGAEEVLALEEVRCRLGEEAKSGPKGHGHHRGGGLHHHPIAAQQHEKPSPRAGGGPGGGYGYDKLEEGDAAAAAHPPPPKPPAARSGAHLGGYEKAGRSHFYYHSRAEVNALIAAARLKYGVQRRRGGYLPYFMLYDATVVVVLLLWTWYQIATLSAQGAPQWLSWSVIYYTKLVWSLSAVPFLIFNVPVVGESMHQSKMTAYDQMGRLVPALSGAMMKRRIEMEQEEARATELESLDDDEAAEINGAALKIQKIRRGSQQRKQVGARLMRHVVSITTPLGFFVSADEIEKWFTFGK